MEKNNNPKKVMMEVHRAEYELLQKIREKYQYGEIVIETVQGLPYRIKKVTEFDKTWGY